MQIIYRKVKYFSSIDINLNNVDINIIGYSRYDVYCSTHVMGIYTTILDKVSNIFKLYQVSICRKTIGCHMGCCTSCCCNCRSCSLNYDSQQCDTDLIYNTNDVKNYNIYPRYISIKKISGNIQIVDCYIDKQYIQSIYNTYSISLISYYPKYYDNHKLCFQKSIYQTYPHIDDMKDEQYNIINDGNINGVYTTHNCIYTLYMIMVMFISMY